MSKEENSKEAISDVKQHMLNHALIYDSQEENLTLPQNQSREHIEMTHFDINRLG